MYDTKYLVKKSEEQNKLKLISKEEETKRFDIESDYIFNKIRSLINSKKAIKEFSLNDNKLTLNYISTNELKSHYKNERKKYTFAEKEQACIEDITWEGICQNDEIEFPKNKEIISVYLELELTWNVIEEYGQEINLLLNLYHDYKEETIKNIEALEQDALEERDIHNKTTNMLTQYDKNKQLISYSKEDMIKIYQHLKENKEEILKEYIENNQISNAYLSNTFKTISNAALYTSIASPVVLYNMMNKNMITSLSASAVCILTALISAKASEITKQNYMNNKVNKIEDEIYEKYDVMSIKKTK